MIGSVKFIRRGKWLPGLLLSFSAAVAHGGQITYTGPPTPSISVVFPILRTQYVEIHYTPALRLGRKGIFITTAGALRKMPPKPLDFVILNPRKMNQWNAQVLKRDEATGLVIVKAPFSGPTFSLSKSPPREGEKVILLGTPSVQMNHSTTPDHHWPDLHIQRAKGVVELNRTIRIQNGSKALSSWAVMDAAEKKILGVVSSSGSKVEFISAVKIRQNLRALGISVP